MKPCTTCGKSDVEFDSVWRAYTDGYRLYRLARCRECTKKWNREYAKSRRAKLTKEYSANRKAQQARYARQRKIVR